MTKTRRIAESITFRGTGLHSGEHCEVTLLPAEGPGIFFDLNGELFPVETAECDGSSRGTRLIFPGGCEVLTVEHLLGALAGSGVWSAVISVKGPEIPAMDGSGAVFAGRIQEAAAGGFDVEPISITREIAFGDPSRGGFIAAIPSSCFEITCAIRYEAEGVGCQIFEGVVAPENFLEDIAPARTFVLASEIDGILARGLGRGGSLDNILVINDETLPDPDLLRVPNEPVRHKVLDLVGDLATLGAPILGRVFAYRAGHEMHLELSRRIRRSLVSVRNRKEK